MTAPAPATTASGSTADFVHRNRTALWLALAAVVALVLLAVFNTDNAQFGGSLDPRNPKPEGAQAVARVLDAQGVDVRVVRGEQAFLDAPVDADTTVVVTNPEVLGRSTFDRLRSRSPRAGATVVVGAAPVVFDAFGLEPHQLGRDDLFADCATPLAKGLTIRDPYPTAVVGNGCFSSDGAVVLHRPADDRRFWLLLAPDVLSNQHVLEADNAALALRLLGQHRKVLWYVADAADVTASDGVTISSLLPGWLYPALWLLLASVLVSLLWRGRRFGPLVREPLPVVVRATETTESRGRLYHRARDRDHAGTILRTATRRRLADLLALPPDAPVPEVVVAVAARTRRDPHEVHRLLTPARVATDSDLAELGRQLLRLEDEVHIP